MDRAVISDKSPLISIVMACYNCESYIGEAIKSVVNQSYVNWELIIVDDGSHDESLRVARRWAEKNDRIIVYSLAKNVGQAEARNVGIQNARGRWVAILDADDRWQHDKLQLQVQQINRKPTAVIFTTDAHVIDKDGNRIGSITMPFKGRLAKYNLIYSGRFACHSSVVYSAEVIKSVGGFNSRFRRSEDMDLWLRLSEIGTFVHLPKKLIDYRRHSFNIGNSSDKDYGAIARVCYYLRKFGGWDLSKSSDDESWDRFLSWICVEYENLGRMAFLMQASKYLPTNEVGYSRRKKLIKLMQLARKDRSFVVRWFLNKLVMHMEAARLARKWIRYIKSESAYNKSVN